MYAEAGRVAVPLEAETMFCATSDCENAASYAVTQPGDKITVLSCFACACTAVFAAHAGVVEADPEPQPAPAPRPTLPQPPLAPPPTISVTPATSP